MNKFNLIPLCLAMGTVICGTSSHAKPKNTKSPLSLKVYADAMTVTGDTLEPFDIINTRLADERLFQEKKYAVKSDPYLVFKRDKTTGVYSFSVHALTMDVIGYLESETAAYGLPLNIVDVVTLRTSLLCVTRPCMFLENVSFDLSAKYVEELTKNTPDDESFIGPDIPMRLTTNAGRDVNFSISKGEIVAAYRLLKSTQAP